MKSYELSKPGGKQKSFKVGGKVFHAIPRIPPMVLLDFAALDGLDVPASDALRAVNGFLDVAIVEDEQAAFKALLRNPDQFIELETLLEICKDLAKEYSANPTGGSSPSTSPETPTGDGSTDGRKPAGTTYSRKRTPPALSVS